MESHPGDTLGTRFLTFWGAITAFFGFALFAMLLQKCSSGVAEDPRNVARVQNLADTKKAGIEELEKLGFAAPDAESLEVAVAALKSRKQTESKAVVPGTETANRLAEEAAAAAAEAAKEGEASTPEAPETPETPETPEAPEP